MASTITRTKTIRIANGTADYFEDKPLNRIVESVHELMESGRVRFDGQSLKFTADDGVDTAKMSVLKDIEEMVDLCGGTLDAFLEDVNRGLNDGTLVVEDGKLMMPEVNTDEFSQVCHDKCLDPQEVLEKATQAVKRGQL